jgi:hypothetical protein
LVYLSGQWVSAGYPLSLGGILRPNKDGPADTEEDKRQPGKPHWLPPNSGHGMRLTFISAYRALTWIKRSDFGRGNARAFHNDYATSRVCGRRRKIHRHGSPLSIARNRGVTADVRRNLVADCPATSAARTSITGKAGQGEGHDDRGAP